MRESRCRMSWNAVAVGGLLLGLSLMGGPPGAVAQPTTVYSELPCTVFLDLASPGCCYPLGPFMVPLCGGVNLNVTTRAYPLRLPPNTDDPYYTGGFNWESFGGAGFLDSIDPEVNPGDHAGPFQSPSPGGRDLLIDFDVPISAFGMSTSQSNGVPQTYADRMRLFDGPLGTGNLIAEVFSEGPPPVQYHKATRFTGFDAGSPVIRSVVIDVQSDQDGLFLDGLAFGSGGAGQTAVADPAAAGPIRLAGPHPNPMSWSTNFIVDLAAGSHVRLEVFDLAGRRVRSLLEGEHQAGPHSVNWDGRGDSGAFLPDGIYFARLSAGGATETRRVHLIR